MLNDQFSSELRRFLSPGRPADEAQVISIDALGADVRLRHGLDLSVGRIGFRSRVETPPQAAAAVRAALAAHARAAGVA
jgi:hypothetical protein